jgi:uncharacterized membrane protein YphA (DoxX/SURF4 family)
LLDERLVHVAFDADPASRWVILIRLGVGLVFLPEGLQKLLFPEILGSGRFAGIGIPWPEIAGPFVGWVELVCGLLLLLGFFTRFAAVPLIATADDRGDRLHQGSDLARP